MLRRKVVERQQLLAILAETSARVYILRLVFGQEGIEGLVGLLTSLGHPDLVQVRLGSGLYALGHLVEYVGRLVHPAALLPRLGIHLTQRRPEAQSTISGGQLWSQGQATPLQIHQQLGPALRALAITILH